MRRTGRLRTIAFACLVVGRGRGFRLSASFLGILLFLVGGGVVTSHDNGGIGSVLHFVNHIHGFVGLTMVTIAGTAVMTSSVVRSVFAVIMLFATAVFSTLGGRGGMVVIVFHNVYTFLSNGRRIKIQDTRYGVFPFLNIAMG